MSGGYLSGDICPVGICPVGICPDTVVIANINEHSHGASAASVEIRLELRLRFNVGFTCYSTIKVFIVISSSPYILFQFQSAPKYWAPKSTGLHRAS